MVEHLADPEDPFAVRLQLPEQLGRLAFDLGRVGRAGAEDELRAGRDPLRGLEQVADPLLARDAPHEEDDGLRRVDAAGAQDVLVQGRRVEVEVDAVVDHLDDLGVHAVGRDHVALHVVADRDHAVGVAVGVLLQLAAEVVAGAQLLDLPGAVGLQRVGGEDERDALERLGQEPGPVRVPGVAVDEVDPRRAGGHLQVAVEGLEDPLVLGGDAGPVAEGGDAADREVLLVELLVAEAADFEVDVLLQLAGEKIDVDAGTAVDVGREFVREKGDAHGNSSGLPAPFPLI